MENIIDLGEDDKVAVVIVGALLYASKLPIVDVTQWDGFADNCLDAAETFIAKAKSRGLIPQKG